MPLWLILVIGIAVTVVAVTIGIRLIRPHWEQHETRRDLGLAIVTTSVFSLAVFALGVLDESRVQKEETSRQQFEDRRNAVLRKQSERDGIRLQLALKDDWTGIDLTEKDLRDFHLRKKIFTEANFRGALLDEANLTDSTLTPADFREVHAEEATFDGADFSGSLFNDSDFRGATFVEAKLEGIDLTGSDFHDADLSGASLSGSGPEEALAGAQYDAETVFTDGKKRRCLAPPCVVKEPD